MNSSLCRSLVNKRIVWALRAVATLAFLISAAPQLRAATVTATWNANSETDIAGYRLSYGTQSGTYTTMIDVGNVTTWQVTLGGGQRYYFAVQAYNTSAQVSGYSAEAFADIPGAPAPVIGSLSPTSGSTGTSITIAGSNFGTPQGASIVRFNGTTATPTSWSATSIVVPVPSGATTGAVVVTVSGIVSNGMNFTVTSSPPSITTLSPTSGGVGTSVTIAGANFGTPQGASTIRFNGTTATPTSWSATSIVAPVPTGATTGPVVVTVNSVASNGVSFTVSAPSLPAPWTSQDVGNPAIAGQASFASGTFSVTGAGVDIWGSSDQFRFVSQVLNGNGEIVARVASLQNTDAWTKAGVMIREDLLGNAPNVVAEATVANGMMFQRRDTRNGATVSVKGFAGVAPQWVRLVRSGNTFSGYYSANGTAWTLMSSSTVAMASQVYVGLAVTSHNPSATATATFTNVTVTGSMPNQAPTLTQPVTQTGAEGTTASVQLVASDPDGNPLTYSATGLPASLSVSPTTGLISGVLTFTSAGTYTATATASDGTLSNSKTFTWNVSNTNQPPTLTQPAAQTSAEGTTVSLQLVASDPDGSALTYSATGLPASLNVNPTTGLISGTLTFTSAGTSSVTATASDGALSNSKTFNWTVTDVGQSPSLTSLSPASGPVGTSVTMAGANFGATQGTSMVRFNGMAATPTSWSATSIVAPVPSGATSGMDVVTVNGVASNGINFTVMSSTPTITSLSPTSGAVGTSVTITGANFGTPQGASVIRFNGTAATPTSWSATSIVAPVPSGATTGPLVVTVNSVPSNGVSFTVGTSGSLPAPWTSQDIGSPAVAGQATFASGTFSVTGGGVDIWGASDQFRFVYQTFAGDGEIIARVGTLQNTDTWAKAGVMIREDLLSNAPNVVAEATVNNGMVFQRRDVRNGATVSVKGFFGGAPQWVRLVRSGNTFSGYYSANGTAWTLMSTATVVMASQVYVGLAVTGHNPSVAGSATFNNVSVNGTLTLRATSAPTVITGSASPTAAQLASGDQASARTAIGSTSPVKALALSDYDGDRRTDIATYRPSTGEWRVLTSRDNYATGIVARWGTATDVPVPGDYDGDRKTDIAYYRPSTGTWSILKSSTNYTTSLDVSLGAGADVPVPGDYDGDGMTDIAVYSPTTGQWRILRSSTNYVTEIVSLWGTATDIPVPGDYDGDGKTDLAVYSPSTGQWKILQSKTDYTANVTIVLGTSTDISVPADYDGDGVTDVAVFQRSTGTWQIRPSSSNFKTIVVATLGGKTDVPVPGDYDGDGKADLAVFHGGKWQILYSRVSYTSGLSVIWGRDTDIPLPRRP